MDVVYLCGEGSIWNNTELKYSLRSLEKYYTPENVYVIGVLPYFLNTNKVKFIEAKNTSRNAAYNIMKKAYLAASIPELSQKFIFMNDDYFLLKPLPENIPYFYKNASLLDSVYKNGSNDYAFHLKTTIEALNKKNLPLKNFDTHCPIIYDKDLLKEVIDSYNWEGLKSGYVLRSLYCNTLGIQGEYKEDLKLSTKRFEPQLKRMLYQKEWFSIADRAINKSLGNFLQETFPTPSKYETIKLLRK